MNNGIMEKHYAFVTYFDKWFSEVGTNKNKK